MIERMAYRRMSVEFIEQSDYDGQSDSSSDDDSGNPPDPVRSSTANPITEKIKEFRQRREELNKAFVQWIPKRRQTKEQLEEIASKLHGHHKNVNKATITGASMGTLGGVLSLAGLIAAPLTFGAGIVVSLIGASIGGAGGLLMSGSKVAEIILTKLGLKDVQQAIDEDSEACTDLQQQLDALDSFISDLARFLKDLLHDDGEQEASGFKCLHSLFLNDYMTSTEEKVDFAARFFRTITSAATVTTSAVATAGALVRGTALAGTGAAHIAGSAISVALIPFDITLLVKSSLELHRGSTSLAVKDLRMILDELKCPDEKEIKMLLKRFIKQKFTEAVNKTDCIKNKDGPMKIKNKNM